MGRFRVIIAGSRDFSDFFRLAACCGHLFSKRRPTCILVGGAWDADALGQRYAEERGIQCEVLQAQWDLLGKQAGFVRNRQMLQKADALIAFWDGHSKGTAHMI